MKKSASPETLKVLYDGACPLCRREIAHAKGLADKRSDSALCFVDISHSANGDLTYANDRAELLARFHVERADGSRIDGAAAFVAMWARLPGWRWLARLARLPGALVMLEFAYRGFLRIRPWLQARARRFEAAPELAGKLTSQRLSIYLERELRSDHAGETGAVYIYKGIVAVARQRNDTELLAFATQHGLTEAEHLRLVETWLPASRRSRLLAPWRLAGWLTGALPALISRRAVYATIAAVETFVDQHYQQQITHLERHGGPEGLLPLLVQCQADERHHRDEAAALAGTSTSWVLRAWCALVGVGLARQLQLCWRGAFDTTLLEKWVPHYRKLMKNSSKQNQLNVATVSEIIELALSDHVGFDHIRAVHGLSPDQVKALMRSHLSPGSYRAWRKRVRRFVDQRASYK